MAGIDHGEIAAGVDHRARDLRPGLALGADLIAGFPTETEALFRDTLALVEEAGLTFLHVFPYSERPGTPAARMPSIPVPERRERAARLREAGREATRRFLAGQVGRTLSVLTETDGSGHSEHFAPVHLPGAVAPGTLFAARAVAANDDHLLAEPA